MTVKDLIEKLQICNKEAEVSIIVDGDSTKKLPLQVWAGGETYGELCGLEDCKHVFLSVSLSGRSTENKE